MALIRAFLILLTIVGSFLVGAPLQLLARRIPRCADVIPRLFCRSLLRLAKVDIAVRGVPTSGPVLLVANHVSWIDILAFRAVAPVCFLAKDDVARWPIVSTFAKLIDTVFVDRSRHRSIVVANATMAARMRQGSPLLLFAEGTTTAGPEPGPFLSSHLAATRDLFASGEARALVAVQPTAIVYSSSAAAWLGDDALVPHLWRVLKGPRLACTVAFGTPLARPQEMDRKALARTARDAVADLVAAHPAAIRPKVSASAADDLAVQPAAGGA